MQSSQPRPPNSLIINEENLFRLMSDELNTVGHC